MVIKGRVCFCCQKFEKKKKKKKVEKIGLGSFITGNVLETRFPSTPAGRRPGHLQVSKGGYHARETRKKGRVGFQGESHGRASC